MIIAIGIDAVDIHRFNDWHTKSKQSLQRIFSDKEIAYCMQNTLKSAERFALRFAIREAAYKIITTLDQHHTIPFLALCKAINIYKNQRGGLQFNICWGLLHKYTFNYVKKADITWHLSGTHTEHIAIAYLIAEH